MPSNATVLQHCCEKSTNEVPIQFAKYSFEVEDTNALVLDCEWSCGLHTYLTPWEKLDTNPKVIIDRVRAMKN